MLHHLKSRTGMQSLSFPLQLPTVLERLMLFRPLIGDYLTDASSSFHCFLSWTDVCSDDNNNSLIWNAFSRLPKQGIPYLSSRWSSLSPSFDSISTLLFSPTHAVLNVTLGSDFEPKMNVKGKTIDYCPVPRK